MGDFYQTFKKEVMLILLKLSKNLKRREYYQILLRRLALP
jgi:hypothetical protein